MTKKSLENNDPDSKALPAIFSRDGHLKTIAGDGEKSLLIPDSLFDVAPFRQTPRQLPYRIDRHLGGQILIQNAVSHTLYRVSRTLYAPFPLGLWALFAMTAGQFDKLILDEKKQYNRLPMFLLQLGLKNERRRMGSDVFSPLIMRQLRQKLSIADYFLLDIGEWIRLVAKAPRLINTFSHSIFWLDSTTVPDKLCSFIG